MLIGSTYAASSDTTDVIIIGAHYDDRGSSRSARAPGANDDGSGTGALVAIARAIARKGVVFHKPVQLVAFAGEEQGMVGSRVYAREFMSPYGRTRASRRADVFLRDREAQDGGDKRDHDDTG